jgi:multidrug efflux pump subunit AcrA (membrane-fusion protein)
MVRQLPAFLLVVVFCAATSSAGRATFAKGQAGEGDDSTAAAADEKKDEKKSDSADADSKTEKASTKEKGADAPAKDDEKKKDAKADEKAAKPETKRKTHKVEPKRLKIDMTLDGTFVADKMTEVPLRPDSWSEFEIVDVVELGAKVHKGQVLLKFDPEKIDEAIQDLELEQRINDLAIARAEEEFPRMEKTLKMDFEEADRSDREAKEDYKRYTEIDRPMTVKSAEFMLKYYKSNLDYEKDELDQLEKMYKADDLTEETEEIVLKRQRHSVEFATFSLERAKLDTDEALNIRLPRMDIRIKDSLVRAALAKARAQMALSLDLDRTRYEMEQRKKARAKSIDKHSKLVADRGLMELKSPADGIVYYGECVNGRWADTASLVTRYKPHNNVSGGSAVMTIVEQRPLYITSQLEEGKRPDVSSGKAVKVSLPSEGGDRVAGKVKSISPIPVGSGKFDISFDIEQDEIPDWIDAGMGCKVSITTYDKADALTVPKKAVHDDESDPDVHYVWLVDPDDSKAKPERREVKIGKKKDDDVEIAKGLKQGDIVSLDDEGEKKEETKE